MARVKRPVPVRTAPSASVRWRALLVVLAAAAAYSNSLAAPFLLDDIPAIVDNPSIRQLSDVPAVLAPPRGLPVSGRPLVNLSLAVNYAAHGLDPAGYRVWNLCVHVLCALLLFGIVRRTLPRELAFDPTNVAFAVALLWALHPLNSEVVDYVTQRTESMMALCFLLTIYCAIRPLVLSLSKDERQESRWMLAAIAASAAGMACKESMVTVPLIVVLYDRLFGFRSWKDAFRARGLFYAGLAATWAVLAALNWSNPRGHSAGLATGVTPLSYLWNQALIVPHYLRLAFWPTSLVVNYGYPRPLSLQDVLVPAAAMAALVVGICIAAFVRPRLGFLGVWFLITLAPSSSIVPIATEAGAERRMYLPLAAVIALVVVGAAMVWNRAMASRTIASHVRSGHRFAIAVVTIAAVLLGMGTMLRNREYGLPTALAQTVIDRWPSGMGHSMMATALAAEGRRADAIAHLRAALATDPRARYALGLELFRDGQLDQSIATLRTFVGEQPDLLEVLSARMIIGRALTRQRRFADADKEFRAILAMVPTYTDAEGGLADALFEQERYEDASAHYRAFLSVHPTDLAALMKLGAGQAMLGRMDEAVDAFQRAVAADPANADARRNLERALAERAAAAK